MARVSTFKNKEVKEKIRAIFTEYVEDAKSYKIVYGYCMQRKFLMRKVSGYILGYDKNKIVAVHIRFNGELIEKPLVFTKENVTNIKIKSGNKVEITSTILIKPIVITVAPSISTTMEGAMIYPINQEDGARQFMEFVKGFLQ